MEPQGLYRDDLKEWQRNYEAMLLIIDDSMGEVELLLQGLPRVY
jgi:hypothetical protein